jgi:predicted esterase
MSDAGRKTVEQTISAGTHGRYLVSAGNSPEGPILVGFHGYGETAEDELNRILAIPSVERWTLVSIQGLHQFYRRRTNEVVANWMTRQNREFAIADNVAYVTNVVSQLSTNPQRALVFTGFSQGVAMAFRAAAAIDGPVAGVIACGGDVPPELDATELGRVPRALIGRGTRDEWYTAEKQASDEKRLRASGVAVQTVALDVGHEWTPEFSELCAVFLHSLLK